MELETPRLHLREFMPADANTLFEMESDPQVLRYVTYGPHSHDEVDADVRFHMEQQFETKRTVFHLAVTRKGEGQMLGWCGIKITNARHREGELGYAFDRDAWGNGYATEASTAMLGFAFQGLELHRIFATTHPEHLASRHILEKLGMKFEGILRGHKWHRTCWRDSALYALLSSDWQGQTFG